MCHLESGGAGLAWPCPCGMGTYQRKMPIPPLRLSLVMTTRVNLYLAAVKRALFIVVPQFCRALCVGTELPCQRRHLLAQLRQVALVLVLLLK